MRIFKTRWFTRFARGERIADGGLSQAIVRAEQGLIDAGLGGGVIKQRVARLGRGRSSGYRVLVACRAKHRAVFLYGFAKREREEYRPGRIGDAARNCREVAGGGTPGTSPKPSTKVFCRR